MEQLSALDKQYIDCKSFIELINPELNILGKKQLPTYLIVPKKQLNAANEITDRYGYIEFIPHRPWVSIDYEDYLKEIIKDTPPHDRNEIIEKIQIYYHQEFDKVIANASKDLSCDYILRNKDEEDSYSFASGCLIAIMITLGIIDMHIENMIVSKKLPVLIDLENSFRVEQTATIKSTLVFSERGSFSHKSMAVKRNAHLLDITGLQEIPIEMIEKNRSYSVYQIRDNKPVPYELDLSMMETGISSTLEIFCRKKKEFLNWFEQVRKFNIVVRYIPLNTSEFVIIRDMVIDDIMSQKDSVNNTITRITENLSRIKKAKTNELGINNDSIFHETVVNRMVVELSQGNIPVYFTPICTTQLLDFNDQPISTNRRINDGSKDFFVCSSYQTALNQFNNITKDIKATESRLITELRNMKSKEKAEFKQSNVDIQEIREGFPSSNQCCRVM